MTIGTDAPGVKWFAAEVLGAPATLAACRTDSQIYGAVHDVEFEGRCLRLLPLVHPRQAAALGPHSVCCRLLHEIWIRQWAPALRARI